MLNSCLLEPDNYDKYKVDNFLGRSFPFSWPYLGAQVKKTRYETMFKENIIQRIKHKIRGASFSIFAKIGILLKSLNWLNWPSWKVRTCTKCLHAWNWREEESCYDYKYYTETDLLPFLYKLTIQWRGIARFVTTRKRKMKAIWLGWAEKNMKVKPKSKFSIWR